jgi:hypothetical protein
MPTHALIWRSCTGVFDSVLFLSCLFIPGMGKLNFARARLLQSFVCAVLVAARAGMTVNLIYL